MPKRYPVDRVVWSPGSRSTVQLAPIRLVPCRTALVIWQGMGEYRQD